MTFQQGSCCARGSRKAGTSVSVIPHRPFVHYIFLATEPLLLLLSNVWFAHCLAITDANVYSSEGFRMQAKNFWCQGHVKQLMNTTAKYGSTKKEYAQYVCHVVDRVFHTPRLSTQGWQMESSGNTKNTTRSSWCGFLVTYPLQSSALPSYAFVEVPETAQSMN